MGAAELPGGKPNPRAGETIWVVESYHNRLDHMVRRALQDGVGGDSLKEFADRLETAKKEVLDAIAEAIRSNGLTMDAYNDSRARSTAKAQETRKAKAAAA